MIGITDTIRMIAMTVERKVRSDIEKMTMMKDGRGQVDRPREADGGSHSVQVIEQELVGRDEDIPPAQESVESKDHKRAWNMPAHAAVRPIGQRVSLNFLWICGELNMVEANVSS